MSKGECICVTTLGISRCSYNCTNDSRHKVSYSMKMDKDDDYPWIKRDADKLLNRFNGNTDHAIKCCEIMIENGYQYLLWLEVKSELEKL